MIHVLVIYEIRNSKIKKTSFEATTAASQLILKTGGKVSVLLIGKGVLSLSNIPEKYGANNVYLVDKEALDQFSPDAHAEIIVEVINRIEATHIFMGATSRGKDLLPRVAFLLNSSLAQDIIDLQIKDGKIIYKRPIIGGKLRASIRIDSDIELATLRPNVFSALEKITTSKVESLEIKGPPPRVIVKDEKITTGTMLDVTEAEIIVSGGRGLKGPENWHLIENLASVLGAAVGASRAVVDAGWREHGEQVGQTGKTVSPNLYLACGISGAIQHLAGMSSSKYIVAINQDPDAPIFKIADYGIVGDLFEVLPKLTEEIKKSKG